MASTGILLLIFTALCVIAVKSAKSGFVNVDCKAKNVGQHGQQSLLECVVRTTKDIQDATIRVVAWKKLASPEDEDGIKLVVFANGDKKEKPGYRFAEPSWNDKNMNVSLLITNTEVADSGFYSCMVITDGGDDNSFTTLNVKAKYSAPTIHSIPEKIIPCEDSTLFCNSDGGYPKGELRWFDEHNKDRTQSAEMEVKQTPSGLFQLSSRFPLLRGSTFSKYTCVVFNASGVKEDEITFEIRQQPLPTPSEGPGLVETSKIVAPLVVIGLLIIGLLCMLLLYRRRSQQFQRSSTAPLMVGHHAVHRTKLDAEAGDQSSEKIK